MSLGNKRIIPAMKTTHIFQSAALISKRDLGKLYQKTLDRELRKETQIWLMGQGVTFPINTDKFSLMISQEQLNTSLKIQISGPKYHLSVSHLDNETETGEKSIISRIISYWNIILILRPKINCIR
jgi:hypothetical protein